MLEGIQHEAQSIAVFVTRCVLCKRPSSMTDVLRCILTAWLHAMHIKAIVIFTHIGIGMYLDSQGFEPPNDFELY